MIADSRFVEGSLLYFEPFIFLNGATPKNKYFIVLKHTDDTIVVASLPTSKDSIPSKLTKQHGCIDQSDINFNCYYYSPTVSVCTNGFAFPKETYVYGFRLSDFDVVTFLQQEKNHVIRIEQKGILTDTEFEALIKCLKDSSSVKNKYRRIL